MSKLLAGAILSFHVSFDSDARLHAVGGTGGIFTDSYEREKTVHMVWEARVISGDDYYHRERSHQRTNTSVALVCLNRRPSQFHLPPLSLVSHRPLLIDWNNNRYYGTVSTHLVLVWFLSLIAAFEQDPVFGGKAFSRSFLRPSPGYEPPSWLASLLSDGNLAKPTTKPPALLLRDGVTTFSHETDRVC
ncbi:hypothetical protein M405DRAFT_883247 [Rhizopogon salebrosus TDB-379]|nr:hypothetical protein M405DRAFT_883247 [Rhizopogon salebrosus TDB-379]